MRFETSPIELDATLTAKARTPIYTQTITVTNTSNWPLIGPLHLVVRDLPKGGGWLDGFSPGRPAYYLRLAPKDGLTLSPGDRVAETLRFVALPSPTAPMYHLGLVRFGGDPSRLH